ncbi:MFS transporter [Ideonella sp. A 288]|uniref:MFS transporter n=1 Tax=Ideonella sp. A 288 TaxID=1962181 RepID=UPI000B4BA43C|nr:MFS transporter [Ideonella sp. A 288]
MPSPTPTPPVTLPRSFRGLAWANLAAQSAEQISLAAVPIVAVVALGAGPGDIGALATAQTLPFLLLSIPAGLLADRWSRRRLTIAAEALRALSLLALLMAATLGGLSIGLLAALGFIGAAGTVGFSVAAPAWVPALVPREALAAANGRLELARSVAFAAGPAAAGALVSWAGGPPAFVLATGLSTLAVALLLRLPEPPRALPTERHVLAELRDGARLVWHHPLLRAIGLTSVAWNIAWFVLQAVYVPYAVRTLGMTADAVGVTLACYGGGMVAGALLAPRVIAALPYGRAVIVGPVFSVLASAVMLATLAWPTAAMAALSFTLFGLGPIVWTITQTTLRQTVTPTAMLGRVSAIFLTVNMGARPVGAALGGAVGAGLGEGAALALSFACFAVQLAVIVFSPMRTLRVLPQAVN